MTITIIGNQPYWMNRRELVDTLKAEIAELKAEMDVLIADIKNKTVSSARNIFAYAKVKICMFEDILYKQYYSSDFIQQTFLHDNGYVHRMMYCRISLWT